MRRFRAGEDTESEEFTGTPVGPPSPRFAWLRRWFRRQPVPQLLPPPGDSPLVVVACVECGFNYSVEKIDFGEGRIGAFWICGCGSRYIPPGGKDSFELVRR